MKRLLVGSVMAVVSGAMFVGALPAIASVKAPTLSITQVSANGSYRNSQTIRISVGPNGRFVPYSRIIILECADPHGSKSRLPTNADTCDGNTVQGDTVLVAKDGSFSEAAFPVYQLPNPALGEPSHFQPVCNGKHKCVLYIGENQEDFTQAKLFSPPFSVTGLRKSSP
jgi:hypothetical protein